MPFKFCILAILHSRTLVTAFDENGDDDGKLSCEDFITPIG